MRRSIVLLLGLLCFGIGANDCWATPLLPDSIRMAALGQMYAQRLDLLQSQYNNRNKDLHKTKRKLEAELDEAMSEGEDLCTLITQMWSLEEERTTNRLVFEVEAGKQRYLLGLEVIRLLYEKILALDHHFASLQSLHQITDLANPNASPVFQKSKDQIVQRLRKNQALQLPDVLQANPFFSASFTVVAAMLGRGARADKQEELEEVACLLDFTAQLFSSLKIIEYETAFLQQQNNALRMACLGLFKEYVEIVEYTLSLDSCRKEDDWEKLMSQIDGYFSLLKHGIAGDEVMETWVDQQVVRLQFSITQVTELMDRYSGFITNGEHYYYKFNKMVLAEVEKASCQAALPKSIETLKLDIDRSIGKFATAYQMAALRGSKLKQLLYFKP